MNPVHSDRAVTSANPENARRDPLTRRAWLLAAGLVLQACAAGPQPAPVGAATGGVSGRAGGGTAGGTAGATAGGPADDPAGAAAAAGAGGRDAPRAATRGQHPLAVERDWLRSWFDGTPVLIAQNGDGVLSVEVPLAFSFEPRRSAVKPALAAVLNKLAQSLRRSGALLPGLAAPPDPAGPPALALQRAAALRAHLLSRGVPLVQLGAPSAAAAAAAAVQLRAEMPPL